MADSLRLDSRQALESARGRRYMNIRFLGEGGTSATYHVLATRGPYSGLFFAAKIFRRVSKPEWAESLVQEHEFLRDCEHPAIMRVYDQGKHGAAPFVIAEYLPQTLSSKLREQRSLALAEKLSLATQLLSALAYLAQHEQQVVHRDIKPTNVFFKGGSWVLGDFGLMKSSAQPVDVDRQILKESVGPRMPKNYRTPDLVEYLRDGNPPTPQSDVFQLGLVLTEVFTGVNPLKSGSFDSDVELDPIQDIPGDLGTHICGLLKRMLTLTPIDRPSAARIGPQWQELLLDEARRSNVRTALHAETVHGAP
jgi:serine/threonine protein kinase